MTNLNKAEHLIKKACEKIKYREDFPHLVCLPEVFNYRSLSLEDNQASAEEIPGGPAFNWACQIAEKLKIWLVAGSILEKDPSSQKPFNTCFVISPEGKLITKYRKINLFKLQLENSPELCEPSYRAAGKDIVNFETPFGKVGLGICFDLRFPEIFAKHRKDGCNIAILPSAFTYKTGQDHWDTLCKARAIETQMYFVAPNQSTDANCWGHSLIIDPWGEVLASLEGENEGYITTKINLSKVEEVRNRIPIKL